MLNNNGPSIEPCGTPNKISCHLLYVEFILVLCLTNNHELASMH